MRVVWFDGELSVVSTVPVETQRFHNTVSVFHNAQNKFIIFRPGRSVQTFPSTGTDEGAKWRDSDNMNHSL